MTQRTSSRGTVFCLGLLIASIGASAAAGSVTDLVVFGDSLSDTGNVFEATRTLSTPPFDLIPSAPYAVGGHHFSNGWTWVEQLALRLRSPHSAAPALRAPGIFTNYAFGGARARSDSGDPFDLGMQVNVFWADFGGQAPPDRVYVVFIGGNDVRDALVALGADPTGATSQAILEDAVTAIANNIVALAGAGARQFLVLNAPNIGHTPAVRILAGGDPTIPIVARQLSMLFNGGLAGALDDLELLLPGIEIRRYDVFAFLEGVVSDPAGAGLDNVTDACLAFGTVGDVFCKDADGYLFWDGIHPTRAGHRLLAEGIASTLGTARRGGRAAR